MWLGKLPYISTCNVNDNSVDNRKGNLANSHLCVDLLLQYPITLLFVFNT